MAYELGNLDDDTILIVQGEKTAVMLHQVLTWLGGRWYLEKRILNLESDEWLKIASGVYAKEEH